MPKQLTENLTTSEASLLNTLYMLTLSVLSKEQKLSHEKVSVFVSSKDMKRAVGGYWSTYRNATMKSLEKRGWCRVIRRYEGAPNGMNFYALTPEGMYSLADINVAKNYTITSEDETRSMIVNGQRKMLFEMEDQNQW